MSTLAWTDSLALNQPRMDTTHREFVELLATVERALDDHPDGLAADYQALVEHTVEHFAQEERWMASIGFAPENCHATQHKHVLDVLREVKGDKTHDRHHHHRRPARARREARAAHVLRLRRQRQLDRRHLPRQQATSSASSCASAWR
jgi:hemerythrin-like metal-binding protein